MDCARTFLIFGGGICLVWGIGLVVFERARYNLHVFEELGWESVLSVFSRYGRRALRFFLYGHFKHKDRVLSALCIAHTLISVSLIVWLFSQPSCVR